MFAPKVPPKLIQNAPRGHVATSFCDLLFLHYLQLLLGVRDHVYFQNFESQHQISDGSVGVALGLSVFALEGQGRTDIELSAADVARQVVQVLLELERRLHILESHVWLGGLLVVAAQVVEC